MQVVTLNNKIFLAEKVEGDTAVNSFGIRTAKPDMSDFAGYVKAENLGELTDITFGNAVFTSRNLTAIEQGSLTMVVTAMEEAKKTAIAGVENARLEQLLSGE